MLITVIGAFFAVPLTCPDFKIDGYKRITSPQEFSPMTHFFCLSSSDLSSKRQTVLQMVKSVLGGCLVSFAVLACRQAFCQFSMQGVTMDYAKSLLQYTDRILSLRMMFRGMAQEQHSRTRKACILGLALLTPLLAPLMGAVIPVTFEVEAVRKTPISIPTAGIAEARTMARINSSFWHQELKDITSSRPYPYTAGNNSLCYFQTSGAKRAYGSGLETISISYPNTTAERAVGIIPLSNVILTNNTVPLNTSDFQIEQQVLLVDQACAFYAGSGQYNLPPANTTAWQDGVIEQLEKPNWSAKYFTAEDVSKFRALVDGPKPSMVYIRDRGDVLLRFKQSVYRVPNRIPTGTNDTVDLLTPVAPGLEAGKIPIHFTYDWQPDNASLTTYSASIMGDGYFRREGSYLTCRTTFVPITYNTTIPAGSSATRRITSYNVTTLSPDAKHLLSQALNFTTQRIHLMDRPGFDSLGNESEVYGRENAERFANPRNNVLACNDFLTTAVADVYPHDLRQRTYPQRQIQYNNDSCIGTEFDLLLKANLLQLSYVPATNPSQPWSWGALETVARPNKWFCLLMVGLAAVTAVLLLALHALVGCCCGVTSVDPPLITPDGRPLGGRVADGSSGSSSGHPGDALVVWDKARCTFTIVQPGTFPETKLCWGHDRPVCQGQRC